MAQNSKYCMRNTKIEEYANDMIVQFLQKYPDKKLTAPVPVEEMLDCLWDFYVEIDDLETEYGEGTHGALFIYGGERRIVIDKSIDPAENPNMKGRYNFSLAHEAGHWMIHAQKLLADADAPTLLGEKGEPTILCRTSVPSKKEEKERQADRFASYLLMPQDLIRDTWYATYGENAKAINVYEELEELRNSFALLHDRNVYCQIARDFAKKFGVSAQAMQIRLSELGFIKLEEDFQLELF